MSQGNCETHGIRRLLMILLAAVMLLLVPGVSADASAVAANRSNQSGAVLKDAQMNVISQTITEKQSFNIYLNNTTKEASWSVSSQKVLHIQKLLKNKYRVTGQKSGTAYVYARVNGKTLKCKVTVKAAPAARMNVTSKTLKESQCFNIYLKNTTKEASWSVSSQKVLHIQKLLKNKYRVTGQKSGTAYIYARVNGKTLKCRVTVKADKVKLAIPHRSLSAVASASPIASVMKSLGAEVTVVNENCDVSKYDGLLLPGGGDIDPARYHEGRRGSYGIDASLDRIQFGVLDQFVKAGKPVLGVCRGNQVINVYFGGSLYQNVGGHMNRRHSTKISAGSLLYEVYGSSMKVYCMHHQCVKTLGTGLKAVQKSGDQVEGIEHETLPIYGVQWHPEVMSSSGGYKLLRKFLSICKEYRKPE